MYNQTSRWKEALVIFSGSLAGLFMLSPYIVHILPSQKNNVNIRVHHSSTHKYCVCGSETNQNINATNCRSVRERLIVSNLFYHLTVQLSVLFYRYSPECCCHLHPSCIGLLLTLSHQTQVPPPADGTLRETGHKMTRKTVQTEIYWSIKYWLKDKASESTLFSHISLAISLLGHFSSVILFPGHERIVRYHWEGSLHACIYFSDPKKSCLSILGLCQRKWRLTGRRCVICNGVVEKLPAGWWISGYYSRICLVTKNSGAWRPS